MLPAGAPRSISAGCGSTPCPWPPPSEPTTPPTHQPPLPQPPLQGAVMTYRHARWPRIVAACAALTLIAACGTESDDDDGGGTDGAAFTPPDLPMLEELGEPEGELNILAWAGYAEDGSTDPAYDWVTPFEQETGCEVTSKYFATSDEAVNLMKTGEYDVVSASGDASLRMIAAGDVEPVNTDLVPNYADIYDFLKDRDWNSVDGQAYGIPHGYGANLLA